MGHTDRYVDGHSRIRVENGVRKGERLIRVVEKTTSSYSKTSQEGVLTSHLFYKDIGPDRSDAKTGPNSGLLKRLISDSITPDQKVQIVDACFKLCVQRLDGGLIVANERLIQMQPAIYPYLRTEIKTTSIASSQYSLSADDIFQGFFPIN